MVRKFLRSNSCINSLTVEDYKADELNKMIEIGKRSNINNPRVSLLMIKSFNIFFNLQIKLI